ncbi:MAG: hypothetical protein AABY15_02525 [Nanoarchaeota archaeon]
MTKQTILRDVWKILVQDFIRGIIDNETFLAIGKDLYLLKQKRQRRKPVRAG